MIKKLKVALAVAALLAFATACGAGENSRPVESESVTPVTNPVKPNGVTPVTKPVEPDSVTPVTKPVEPDSVTPVTKPVEPDSVTPVTKPVEPDSVTPVTKPVEPDSATPTPKVVWVVPWPDSWPVPPLPVMWLEHESGPTRGAPHMYYWRFEDAFKFKPTYQRYAIWSGVREYPEVEPGSHVPIKIDADTRPTKMFAQVFTRTGAVMVGGLRRPSTVSPALDLSGVGPGVYNVRIIGHWEDNRVAYEFGLSIPGAVKLKSLCSQTVIGTDPILTLESLDDRLRTAPDNANSGGCSFNKRIAHISMTLQNNYSGPYTETFHIDPPSVSVSFPLRDDFPSERTGEPLPPGEYSRRIYVIAEDGEKRQIRLRSPDVVTLAGP